MAELFSNMAEKLANHAVEMIRDCSGIEETMQTLGSEIQVLRNRAGDVLSLLEEEEILTGRKRKREVKDWLEKVEAKKLKFDSLYQQLQQTRFYHLNLRLQLGRHIKEMRLEVEKLAEDGKFSDGLFLKKIVKTKGKPLLTAELNGLPAFDQNFDTVWAWLMNDADTRIGIHGMGGVGKTTLAMHLHDKLLMNPTFKGHVYWIYVSLDSNVHKLQNDIANVINLDLSNEESENQRAARLFEALKRRKRFVLILDDVWKNFNIDKVGIPFSRSGSNLLITSRSVDVCHRMGCNKILRVEVLREKESWELFLDKLGCNIRLSPETKQIAKEVAKLCAGLPLGIITMSGSMRGVTDIHEWRDTLEELNESLMEPEDMETEVFPVLSCSFNRLKDKKLQHCFLYCSLYPEGYRIPREELINKFISEGLMDKRKNRQASFDQGHKILNKLENVSLLERTDYECVKMHDLIRDMALRVTRINPIFMVKAGLQLFAMPEEQEWNENLDKVSLMCNKISYISPCISPKCYKLSTLILRRNPLRMIPDTLFLHMHGLLVLDLSSTWIESLPNSIVDLENLKALFLACCFSLKYMPSVRKLLVLEELDLYRTQINELPPGVQNLVNLKFLNLGAMKCLKPIQPGILPKLSKLERLIVPDHLQVPVEEIEELKELEEFQGRLSDVLDLNKFVISQKKHGKPKFYNIFVGESDSWSTGHYNGKVLTCKKVTLQGYLFKRETGTDEVLLPHDIQHLRIVKCVGLGSFLSNVFPSLDCLSTLKRLSIGRTKGIECISRYTSSHLTRGVVVCIPFQSLEIILYKLPNLISVVNGDLEMAPPSHRTFSCLKVLRIKLCDKIKKLFTVWQLKGLQNLEEIHVSECAELEELIANDEGSGTESTSIGRFSESFSSQKAIVLLPKLRILSLKWLPQFKSICKETVICDSIENVLLLQCHGLKRLPFYLHHVNGQPSPSPALEHFWIGNEDKEWWDSMEWDYASSKDFLLPYVKFLDIGHQTNMVKSRWKPLMLVFLFIRRLQVRIGS